jgi:LytR cell envelope-related transcriptional attenuator
LPEIIQEIGAYAGLASVVGLAVISALYFSQARDVKRLREWAGRAPERAEQGAPAVPGRVVAQPQAQPEPGAKPEPARPAAPPVPGQAPVPVPGRAAPAPAAQAPAPAPAAAAATGARPAAATPAGGRPAPVPAAAAASGQAAASAGQASAPSGQAAASAGHASAPSGQAAASAGEAAASAGEGPASSGQGATTAAPPRPAPAPAGANSQGATQAPPKPAVPVPGGGNAGARPPAPPVPRPSPASRAVPQPTAIIPPPRRERWYRRLAASPLYLVLTIAGVLIVGGAAAFGVTQLVSDDAGSGSGQSEPRISGAGDGGGGGDEGRQRQRRRGGGVNPASVTVAVLNGTTVPGLAATLSDQVEAAGFQEGTIANFLPNQQLAESVVQYTPGHEREATAVGRKLDITQREAANPSSQELAGDATVIVLVGADKAP